MIQMNDFRADPRVLIDEELAACERVLHSGWFVLGEEVKRFEAAWAARCGTANAVGVGNGLDAIEIGLRALDIGPGDEVITTPMTAFATVLGIIRAGATPVLADIDPDTALLDPNSVARCIGSKTKAVLLVHMYGQIRGMSRWVELCNQHGLHLLEDCAQSHLASEGGRVAGSFGMWGAYSFYPTKNLGAVGDGGALVANDERIVQNARTLRNYGQATRYEHTMLGMNSRLDEMQAAILNVRINWLKRFTQRRQVIAQRYQAEIRNPQIRLLAQPLELESHVYHLFVVRCADREHLMQYLKSNGIESLIHYPIPAHMQPASPGLLRDPNGLMNAEHHAKECMSIPCHHNMADEEVTAVVQALNAFGRT